MDGSQHGFHLSSRMSSIVTRSELGFCAVCDYVGLFRLDWCLRDHELPDDPFVPPVFLTILQQAILFEVQLRSLLTLFPIFQVLVSGPFFSYFERLSLLPFFMPDPWFLAII
jgi:hypothetical protein